MISLILAMDENRVIGKDNQLPWHLPADLKYFKNVTMNHAVVMGRKTFASIGKALPGRQNFVLTHDPNFQAEGCTVIHSVQELCLNEEEEIFIIGGAKIFQEFLPVADRLYITLIHATFEGDTYFPEINEGEWKLCGIMHGTVDEKNRYEHDFLIYERT